MESRNKSKVDIEWSRGDNFNPTSKYTKSAVNVYDMGHNLHNRNPQSLDKNKSYDKFAFASQMQEGYFDTLNYWSNAYITENEYHKNNREVNERISRLEKLVWKMYEELDQRLQQSNNQVLSQIEEQKDSVGTL